MNSGGKRRRRYRSRIEIAADILDIAREGSRKTRIMYMGNLSFDLLEKYLTMLTKFNMVELRNIAQGEKTYVATEKGRKFLEDFRDLQEYSRVAEAKKRALEASLTLPRA